MFSGKKDAAKRDVIALRLIFVSFTKVGAVLFGGGYAMLPLLEREVVNRRQWCRFEEMAAFAGGGRRTFIGTSPPALSASSISTYRLATTPFSAALNT